MLPPTDDDMAAFRGLGGYVMGEMRGPDTVSTLADYRDFLSALVATPGEGRIGGFRVDEGRYFVRVQIRHALANWFRPARRTATAHAVYESISWRMPAQVLLQVEASYVPLWMRRKPEAPR